MEDAFDKNFSNLYQIIFKDIIDNKPVKSDNPYVGITYHGDKIVLLNYSDKKQDVKLIGAEDEIIDEISIDPCDIYITGCEQNLQIKAV